MLEMALGGAQILGGCCGTTPAHLKKTVELCEGIEMKPVTDKILPLFHPILNRVIGDKPVLIGERINPTGKKKFKEALLKGDYDYVVEQGIPAGSRRAYSGCHVGLPGINESDAWFGL